MCNSCTCDGWRRCAVIRTAAARCAGKSSRDIGNGAFPILLLAKTLKGILALLSPVTAAIQMRK